jgi:hypothetical protein
MVRVRIRAVQEAEHHVTALSPLPVPSVELGQKEPIGPTEQPRPVELTQGPDRLVASLWFHREQDRSGSPVVEAIRIGLQILIDQGESLVDLLWIAGSHLAEGPGPVCPGEIGRRGLGLGIEQLVDERRGLVELEDLDVKTGGKAKRYRVTGLGGRARSGRAWRPRRRCRPVIGKAPGFS